MKYTFQHFIDLKTSGDSMQIIQVNAGGQYALERVKHLIGAFKMMKLGRISIKLLPASTLPVDVLGLSYDDDDMNTIDPRDQMNPGLVRITNGEDLYTDVSSLTEDQQMGIYNNMMLDARWSKFMLQSGFKRSATPLYWQIGQLHQDYYPGSTMNIPQDMGAGFYPVTTSLRFDASSSTTTGRENVRGEFVKGFSDPRGFFQVGHRGKLGWIPTDALIQGFGNGIKPGVNNMPEIQCITVVLPKAYKTVYYYRMFITETVYFAGLKNTGITGADDDYMYRGIDNFVYPTLAGAFPGQAVPNNINVSPDPPNTGGGE